MKKLIMYKKCMYVSFIFIFCTHLIQTAPEIQAPKKTVSLIQDPRMSQSKGASHYVANLQAKLPHVIEQLPSKPIQKKNIAPDNNLQMVAYNPKANLQAHIPSDLTLIPYERMTRTEPAEQQTFKQNINIIKPKIEYDEHGNPTTINNTGVQQKLGFDNISKTYFFEKDNSREYLDPNVTLPADVHQKIIDIQNINIKKLQDTIIKNQAVAIEKPPVTTTIEQTLSNLWKNSKIPTAFEIKETFKSMYTTLQDTLHVTITEPMKNTLFKQATKTIPDGKNQKQIDSWSKSIQKKIYQWTVNLSESILSFTAKNTLNIYQDIADLPIETQTAYLATKYLTYMTCLDMYQVIHPTVADIANKLSDSITQEIIGNQAISQKDMDAIHEQFAQKFTQWTQGDASKLENAYKTLGIESTVDATAINKAYKKLALKNHPDKTSGSQAKFQEIKEAYDIITKNNENKSTNNLEEQIQEKMVKFTELITSLIQDIKNTKTQARQAEQPLRDAAIKKLKNIPSTTSNYLYQSIVEDVIQNGVPATNTNGTMTYTITNRWSKESSSVTVDKQGNITNIRNIEYGRL